MTIYCNKCKSKATFVEEEVTFPNFDAGYFECRECGNDGRITEGSHYGNAYNGFFESD